MMMFIIVDWNPNTSFTTALMPIHSTTSKHHHPQLYCHHTQHGLLRLQNAQLYNHFPSPMFMESKLSYSLERQREMTTYSHQPPQEITRNEVSLQQASLQHVSSTTTTTMMGELSLLSLIIPTMIFGIITAVPSIAGAMMDETGGFLMDTTLLPSLLVSLSLSPTWNSALLAYGHYFFILLGTILLSYERFTVKAEIGRAHV